MSGFMKRGMGPIGLLVFLLLPSYEGSVALGVPPLPARIGGTVKVDGVVITQATGTNFKFRVTKADGTAYIPVAEDDGLNAANFYVVDIPFFDATSQPGGAKLGERAQIHVIRGGVELTVNSPSGGGFTVGDSGSITQIDLEASGGATLPNLTPYQPPGWSDKVVVATAAGVTTDSSPLLAMDTLYVSWAAINNGNVSVPASPNYWFYLYLDGNLWGSWYADFALNPNTYLYAPDNLLGSLSQGAHTLRLVCDATNVVVESNEGDNEYTKTITVSAAAGGSFSTVSPCRVLDTRNPTGALGAPALQAFATRTFDPSASTCGIPADAVAISANLTVTNVGALGELVVFPADVLRPNTSALSFRAGRTRANNAIISFSKSSTTFSVFNNSAASVDFILDVNGFFR